MMRVDAASGRRAALALTLICAVVGVALQGVASIGFAQARGLSAFVGLWRMLLYFTVLTNILVALVCVASLRDGKGEGFFASPATQGATALYIAIVGAIYNLVLADLWIPQGLQYVADLLIHDVTPALYVATWLVVLRRGALEWRQAPAWLVYPCCYFAYVLGRAALNGIYPYPFLDVAREGAWRVSLNGVALLLIFLALSLAIIALDRAMTKR